MTSPRHYWADAEAPASDGPPAAHLTVPCHRRLRGPYTAGGTLLRHIVPELIPEHGELVARRATEVIALAPEVTPLVPQAPQTLTNLAGVKERTRFYPATRALRLAHGAAELLMDWARVKHPGESSSPSATWTGPTPPTATSSPSCCAAATPPS